MNPVVNEGHRAFYQLVQVDTGNGVVWHNKPNPYPAGSIKAKEWERGWNKAYRINKRKAQQYA